MISRGGDGRQRFGQQEWTLEELLLDSNQQRRVIGSGVLDLRSRGNQLRRMTLFLMFMTIHSLTDREYQSAIAKHLSLNVDCLKL